MIDMLILLLITVMTIRIEDMITDITEEYIFQDSKPYKKTTKERLLKIKNRYSRLTEVWNAAYKELNKWSKEYRIQREDYPNTAWGEVQFKQAMEQLDSIQRTADYALNRYNNCVKIYNQASQICTKKRYF